MSRRMIISSCCSSKVTSRCSAGSSCSPPNTSRSISATRRGVSTSPGRSGSSPTACSRSATARSTARLSCTCLAPQTNQLVEDGPGDGLLRQHRQVHLPPVATEDGDLVVVGGKAAAGQGDVVGYDQVQPLPVK